VTFDFAAHLADILINLLLEIPSDTRYCTQSDIQSGMQPGIQSNTR
jgi:hypothetical protein